MASHTQSLAHTLAHNHTHIFKHAYTFLSLSNTLPPTHANNYITTRTLPHSYKYPQTLTHTLFPSFLSTAAEISDTCLLTRSEEKQKQPMDIQTLVTDRLKNKKLFV